MTRDEMVDRCYRVAMYDGMTDEQTANALAVRELLACYLAYEEVGSLVEVENSVDALDHMRRSLISQHQASLQMVEACRKQRRDLKRPNQGRLPSGERWTALYETKDARSRTGDGGAKSVNGGLSPKPTASVSVVGGREPSKAMKSAG